MQFKRLLLIFSGVLLLTQLQGQTAVNLHPDQAGARINPEIYGHFAEHLGRCIYGGIFVDEDSNIPNVRGFRSDVIEALKELDVPVLRWPGGCFGDTYHWKDGLGPREDRPSIVNVHWGGVTEDNSFGTHEFLEFCELIGAEPYININVGSGTVQEASEWVEYVTSSNESPMTKLRRENGREEPWQVKYWGIGNENWGCGGHMTPEYYADLYRRFASYCRGDIYKIAGGPNVDDYNWTRVLMEKTARYPWLIQGLSLHSYTLPEGWLPKVSATEFEEDGWAKTMRQAYRMDELISRHSAIMDQYDPNQRIGLIVDEWGTWFQVEPGTNPGFLYQQNTLRDALVAGIHLNTFNQHADRVKMANIAQMVNVLQAIILTKDDQMVLTPTYYVFKMYSVHQGADLLPVNFDSPKYSFGGMEMDALNASASIKDGEINFTICNLDPENDHPITLTLTGESFSSSNGQIVTAENMQDYNDFGRPEAVTLSTFKVPAPKKNQLEVVIPAKSVVHIQLKR
ncbi:MAG: alpha-N-arabinofuranosidase [Bacteroidia bacterium]|nr:alpha-N-arabinofuranosidase [Bacteroidia bacterium]